MDNPIRGRENEAGGTLAPKWLSCLFWLVFFAGLAVLSLAAGFCYLQLLVH